MQIPLINANPNGAAATAVFSGLNRTDKGTNGEYIDMVNMASCHYPCLSPRESREQVCTMPDIRAVIAPKYEADTEKITAFTGVAKNTFYYNGNAIEFEAEDMAIPSDTDIHLADFNGKIIICAYDTKNDNSVMYYYDYTATGAEKDEDGNIKTDSGGNTLRYVKRMEKGIYGISCRAVSIGNPDTDSRVTNYIQYVSGVSGVSAAKFKWSDYFSVGDAIFLEGFENDVNNTVNMDSRYEMTDNSRALSCVIDKIDGNKLYFQMYNYASARLVMKSETASDVNVFTKIPVMNHICIHNNRLWGTNPNGEYVYASKLGDCFNFNSFQGLTNDSYYSEIGTAGDFIGIVSYRDNLVAFKRDYIHHIYGDKPSNFTIPKQLADCGCIDIRSAVEIGAVLYFLGYNGFYEYTGGQPTIISTALNCSYKSAVGMSDGNRYIASAVRRDNGETELLVYDTRYGIWHKEDNLAAVGSFRRHNDLYIAASDEVIRCGYGDEKVKWQCDSVISYENIFDNKGINEIWIRAKLDEGASITVYTSVNGGEWIEHEILTEKGLKVYRIPVRFINGEYYQYRLAGTGGAVIYDVEHVISSGGKPYKKGW